MSTGKQKVLLNSIIYIFSNVAIKGLSFLLLPLYTTKLTAEEYGLTGIINNFISVALIIVSFDVQVAVSKFYIAYSEDKETISRIVGTLYCFIFISGVLFLIVSFFLRNSLVTIVFGRISFFPVVFLTIITILFNCIYSVNQSLFQIMQDAKKEMIFNGVLFLSTFLLNYTFVAIIGLGVTGVIISSFLAYFVYLFVTVHYLKKKKLIRICLDLKLLRSCLKYSIPLIPHNLASSITPLVSNVLIKNHFNFGTVGSFTLASKFGVICDIVQGSINKAYTPYLFRKLKEGKSNLSQEIIEITEMIIYINGFVFILVNLFAKEAIHLLSNGNYPDVWEIVPLITMVYLVKIPYHFYIGTLFYFPETSRKIFFSTILAAVTNIYFSFVLIPKFGINGSVYADIIAMMIRVSIILIISRGKIPVKYKVSNFAIPILIILFFIIAGSVCNYLDFGLSSSKLIFLLKLAVFLLYFVIIIMKYWKQAKTLVCKMLNKNE